MTARAGFVWGTKQHFNRYIEECGIVCELITPQMLAAPFYRTTISCLIIPTGFANTAYSNILPAVRASSSRITRFIENGGNLLVFGAAIDRPDAYDWLPFSLTYTHSCSPRPVTCHPSSAAAGLIDDYDASRIECDGTFISGEAEYAGSSGGDAVIIEKKIGAGTVIVTSIHEFPSRKFLQDFCNSGKPVMF